MYSMLSMYNSYMFNIASQTIASVRGTQTLAVVVPQQIFTNNNIYVSVGYNIWNKALIYCTYVCECQLFWEI